MRKILLITLLGLGTVLGTVGCRSDSNNTPDGGGGGGGDGGGGGGADADLGMITTVKNLRMNQPTNGTLVTLQNVVVVGRVASSKTTKIWVQDQGGGQYSGIEIYCKYGSNCTLTQTAAKAIKAKAVVNVTGKFDSFAFSNPPNAQPTLEIESPVITDTGSTMAPVAVDVTAATIAMDQFAAGGGADPYKGAYVHVSDATSVNVTNVMAGEYQATCSDMTMPTPLMGTTYDGFEAKAGSATLAVGLTFYSSVDWCIPCVGSAAGFNPYPCPDTTSMYPTQQVTGSTTFKGISGVVETESMAGSGSNTGTVYLQIAPTYDGDIPTM